MSDKISIRFFNDREVRAAWDSANSQWLFSVVDVIAILTESKLLEGDEAPSEKRRKRVGYIL